MDNFGLFGKLLKLGLIKLEKDALREQRVSQLINEIKSQRKMFLCFILEKTIISADTN